MKRIKNIATIEITEIEAKRLLQALTTEIQVLTGNYKKEASFFPVYTLNEKKEVLNSRLSLIEEIEKCQDELSFLAWIKDITDEYIENQEKQKA